MTPQEMVREFHEKFELPLNENPGWVDDDLCELRKTLIQEESEEVVNELENPDGNIYNLAKELADLLYTVYGTAITFGIDLDRVLKEVHESNMTKLSDEGLPIRRWDGKILKGPNYVEPRVRAAVENELELYARPD